MMKNKEMIFEEATAMLSKLGFTVIQQDRERPWGGFLVIDEKQADKFAAHFFSKENINDLKITEKLSPKFLLVAPHKRLSWQYHHRRAEIWRCVEGRVGVVTSDTDEEKAEHILNPGDIIKLQKGERHRLKGLNEWGIVAEIWQHTDRDHHSDEDDIVRLQDDFRRK
jgi:mannose-6-phosphate isomerase